MRGGRGTHMYHILPVASSYSQHHKRSIQSPFHLPWDKEANCPLPSTKRGLQYSQPGVTVASGEGADTPACYKNAPPQSGTAPTSGSRQVRQQQIPSLTDVEHNGYGNKKVKRIKTQENWAKEKKNS